MDRIAWCAVGVVVLGSCGAGDEPDATHLPEPRWPDGDAHRPQAVAGGFALTGGGTAARLDAAGVAVGAGWRFAVDDQSAAVPEVDGDCVVFRRAGLLEWYQARADGVEQGFTVDQRPAGDLVIAGTVHSHASGRLIEGGVAFGDLHYVGLEAWDASGRPLAAELSWDGTAGRVTLRVAAAELADADFPVTLDPLLYLPGWQVDLTDQ